MNELTECPKCLSDELLISDNENTVLCSDCGVIKKMGCGLLLKSLILKLRLNNRHKKAHIKVWANILICCRFYLFENN